MQARAAFLVSVLADFEQLEGPGSDSLYACKGYDAGGTAAIRIVVERDDNGHRCEAETLVADRTVTRRGLPILVEAETDQTTFTFTLTDDIILNATDLFPDGGDRGCHSWPRRSGYPDCFSGDARYWSSRNGHHRNVYLGTGAVPGHRSGLAEGQ